MPRRRPGWRIRDVLSRLADGQTISQVAAAVGVTKSTVSRYARSFVKAHKLIRTSRYPALHRAGPALRPSDRDGRNQRTLLDFAETPRGVVPFRNIPVETEPGGPPRVIRFHKVTMAARVIHGPDPARLRWQGTWEASGALFFRTVMPLVAADDEDGAGIVLAWGPERRTFEVTFPPLWLTMETGRDLGFYLGQILRAWAEMVARWIPVNLGYEIGDIRLVSQPHMATSDVGQRILVPGMGYVRISDSGDAWVDESLGMPELETTNTRTMEAWLSAPEVAIAKLVDQMTALTKRLDELEARIPAAPSPRRRR